MWSDHQKGRGLYYCKGMYVCILRKSFSLLDNAPNYLLLLSWVRYPKGAVQWPAVQILTTGLHNIIYNLWKNDYLWLDLICTWDIVQEIVIESLLFLRSNSLNLQNVDICNYLLTYLLENFSILPMTYIFENDLMFII